MSERPLRVATGVFALVGAAIAGYLSYTRLTDASIICPTSGCGSVQRSEYATLIGVPVAYLGVVGYLAIAATALSARRWARTAGLVLVLVAAGFGTYLLVAQVALIHAVCTWCVGSEAVGYTLLLVAVLRRYPGLLRSRARRIGLRASPRAR